MSWLECLTPYVTPWNFLNYFTLLFMYVLLCPSVRSILSASHPLEKTTQWDGKDFRRFGNQKDVQNMHRLCLLIATSNCWQWSQDNRQMDRSRANRSERLVTLSTPDTLLSKSLSSGDQQFLHQRPKSDSVCRLSCSAIVNWGHFFLEIDFLRRDQVELSSSNLDIYAWWVWVIFWPWVLTQ